MRSIIAVVCAIGIIGLFIWAGVEYPECFLSECERNGGTQKVVSTTTGYVNGNVAYLQTTECEMPN
jgi:hypothetical protein